MLYGGPDGGAACDCESPEVLALVLRGRAELLLELSEVLPRLMPKEKFEASVSAWLRAQIEEVNLEAELFARHFDTSPAQLPD